MKLKNYINGELIPPNSDTYLDNINPATAEVYSYVPNSDASDVDAAVQAAKEAFPAWSAKSREERAAVLRQLAQQIAENQEKLIEAETRDTGKPISLARRVDVPRSQKNLEFYADEVLRFNDLEFSRNELGQSRVSYQPLGVVGIISPWNLPLYLLTWKVAPALAAGNTVVAKPSEVTPMTAYLFSELCEKAGVPKGVLNIVHGQGSIVGDAMTSHPDIQAVSFTGSTGTGKIIAKKCAASLKKYSLEMGGKNPTIIFADCDFTATVDGVLRAAFTNQGQVCLCASRIYIERSLYESFKDALVQKAKLIIQGDPFDETTDQGSVVSKEQYEKVMSYINYAKDSGARILCGGNGSSEKGYFIEPSLIEGVGIKDRLNQEEIFGAVATLTPFDSEEEALSYANDTEYGLSASVWTEDIDKGNRLAQKINSGVVWINTWMARDLRTPFGGMKQSGQGREGGVYSLQFFSEMKTICVK
jgi:aminomuconate-semialdehyde/2-hydroxymuconate-6-semialdehyde dehydrogenase